MARRGGKEGQAKERIGRIGAGGAGQSSAGELAHRSSAIYATGRRLKNIPAARAARCSAAEAFAFSPDACARGSTQYLPVLSQYSERLLLPLLI